MDRRRRWQARAAADGSKVSGVERGRAGSSCTQIDGCSSSQSAGDMSQGCGGRRRCAWQPRGVASAGAGDFGGAAARRMHHERKWRHGELNIGSAAGPVAQLSQRLKSVAMPPSVSIPASSSLSSGIRIWINEQLALADLQR